MGTNGSWGVQRLNEAGSEEFALFELSGFSPMSKLLPQKK